MPTIRARWRRRSSQSEKARWRSASLRRQKENDVPFYQDNKLAETLSRLQIGDTIPPELYEVVAEILVFVDDMDRMKGKLKESGLL